jgi:crotonobetainyl-CoA:carnitine CoA-transferase CaiB-like acyl-CoA transferase
MSGALEGLTVIDFGQYVAGPLTAMLLGDQGAHVVRVDPPGGPRFVTPANQVWNRGKSSIVLDLQSSGDRATAQQLVRAADVVVENFRPGVMDRLGLGHASMIDANPGLVYCSLPGFSSQDPRAPVAAWEGVVEAAAAAYVRRSDAMSGSGDISSPLFSVIALSSVYAALLGAVSISMALNARARDGLGQWIEVPLFDATFVAHGFAAQHFHSLPDARLMSGTLTGIHSWNGEYECKDGRYILFLTSDKRAGAFIDAVGGTGWENEPDFAARARELFLSRTAAEWEQLGDSIGTQIVMARSSAEWLRERHARESGLAVEVDDLLYGKMLQPGVQVHLASTPGSAGSPASSLDADRPTVLRDLGAPQPVVQAGTRASASVAQSALEGIRVLDLTILLAGPTCGRALAEFGADVIKVDIPPGREAADDRLLMAYRAMNIDVNRGKRSIVIDLKTPEGIELFWQLAAKADVIVENFRAGVMDDLGIGYDAVHQRHPSVVYASVNTYGQVGPWRGRPGHDQMGQWATGMAARFGGDGPPTLTNARAVNDYGAGVMGAYAVALALIERRRTGLGQHVSSTLVQTGAILQAPQLYDFDGRIWDEPRGQNLLGIGPFQRLYRAKDGWMFLGLREDQAPSLESVPGLDGVAQSEDVESLLEERLLTESTGTWTERFTAAGCGAHRVTTLPELIADEWVRSHGLIVTREHKGLGLVDHVGAIPRLSRTPTAVGAPAAAAGSGTHAILAECELLSEADRLARAGAINHL